MESSISFKIHREKKSVTEVGFEPTPPKRLEKKKTIDKKNK